MTDTDVLNKRRKFGTSDEVTENFDAIAFALKFWCNRSGDASSIMDGFLQSSSSSTPAVAALLVKIGPTREHITEIRKSFSLKQTQGPVCTAAEYSAKCDATLLVTSHTAFQRNILPNTSAEYSAGNKCATSVLVLHWFAPSIQ